MAAEYIGIRNSVSSGLGISDGTHSETLIFRADAELPIYDQVAEVLAHENFPTPGVTFHSFFTQLVCQSATPERDVRSVDIWYVATEWGLNSGTLSSGGDSATAPQPQWGDPPERWYPTIRYGSEFRMVNRDAAKTRLQPANKLPGVTITNFISTGSDSEILYLPVNVSSDSRKGFFTAAGEVYSSPGIQVREQVDSIEITRYERAFVLNDEILSYPRYRFRILGKVNSKTWHEYPPRTVLLEDISASTVWYGGTAYNQVTYLFKFDLNFPGRDSYQSESDQTADGGDCMTSSHDPIILHAGYQAVIRGQIRRILDEDGNPLPNVTPLAPRNNWPAVVNAAGTAAEEGFLLSLGAAYPADAWVTAQTESLPYIFPFICQREKEEFDFAQLNLELDRYFPTMFNP